MGGGCWGGGAEKLLAPAKCQLEPIVAAELSLHAPAIPALLTALLRIQLFAVAHERYNVYMYEYNTRVVPSVTIKYTTYITRSLKWAKVA